MEFLQSAPIPEKCVGCKVAHTCVDGLGTATKLLLRATDHNLRIVEHMLDQEPKDGSPEEVEIFIDAAAVAKEAIDGANVSVYSALMDGIERDTATVRVAFEACEGFSDLCGLPSDKLQDLTEVASHWHAPGGMLGGQGV